MPNETPHPFVVELHDLAAKHNIEGYVVGFIFTDAEGVKQYVAAGAMKLGQPPSIDGLKQMFEAVDHIERGLVKQASPPPRELMN